MDSFQNIGKMLIISGVIIALLGILITFSDRIPFLGKLPGDIKIKKENFVFYFPVVTSILISILISLIIYFFNRMRK
ncbi:MAG: DUF2905 domain-containing protein [Bacteroidetes bacterium]|nr:DUF2905 domain-containing protein [Bacteroidota bacterium]